MNIVIIGTGNVATILGKLLLKNGHQIVKIFGRNEIAAFELANELNTQADKIFNYYIENIDIVILAISDTALTAMHEHSELKNHLVVHTAGSIPMEILAPYSQRIGVLYPLQRLNKNMEHEKILIPFLIDAQKDTDVKLITELAQSISNKISRASDEQRLLAHVAAVFTCNFTNHIYTMMSDWCIQKNINFNMLLPLIDETTKGLHEHKPETLQTGPAIRHDFITMMRHQDLLEIENKDLLFMYNWFSEKIQKRHT